MVLGRLAKKLLGGGGGGATTCAAAAPQPPPFSTPTPKQQQYAGVNCYYLLTRAADPGCRPMVEATLDALASTPGLTVVRCWAFCDGARQWNAFQPHPGQLDERVFQALDWLLDAAGKRGLQLQLTLTNFWKDFGGMPQYVAWARSERGQGAADSLEERGDAFFDDPRAQEMFRSFLERVVTRFSTITGRPYRDDPAIHAWDLVNEARCELDGNGASSSSSSNAAKLTCWLHETAAFVKSLDPNHRVTAGLEGFFGPSTPDLAQRANPYSSALQHGADFVACFSSPHLDFCCIHLYPNQWLSGASNDDSQRIQWAATWVEAHAQACISHLNNKPLCVQEFGWKASAAAGGGGGVERRAQLFSAVLGACAKHSHVIEGALAWMFADPSYPDYDGYTLYPGDGRPTAEAERQSCGGGRVEADVGSLAALAAFGEGRPAPA